MTTTSHTQTLEATPAIERDRLALSAVLLSSFIVPLPILASVGLEALFDGINPAGLDVRQPTAYLRELLGYGFGLLALLLLAIAVVCTLLYRNHGGRALVLPVAVIVLQVLAGVAILYFNGAVDGIEAGYVASSG